MPAPTRRLHLFAVALAVLFVASACGGASDSVSVAPAQAESPQPIATTPAVEVAPTVAPSNSELQVEDPAPAEVVESQPDFAEVAKPDDGEPSAPTSSAGTAEPTAPPVAVAEQDASTAPVPTVEPAVPPTAVPTATAEPTPVPTPVVVVPELTGQFLTIGGGQIDLGSLQGQDVVLWFWAPW